MEACEPWSTLLYQGGGYEGLYHATQRDVFSSTGKNHISEELHGLQC
jgi:hypothetical protein